MSVITDVEAAGVAAVAARLAAVRIRGLDGAANGGISEAGVVPWTTAGAIDEEETAGSAGWTDAGWTDAGWTDAGWTDAGATAR